MSKFTQGCSAVMASMVLMTSAFAATTIAAPALTGKMVFHRYSSYDAWDSQLYLYNFVTKQLTELSANWGIDNAMNASFSPDGKWITFMGVPTGQHYFNAWKIYLWQVGSSNPPVNLTQGDNLRDEDPKFLDSQHIVFKQNGDIKIINLSDFSIKPVTNNGWTTEESMPYPLFGTTRILYAQGSGSSLRVCSIDQSGAYNKQLINSYSYYPVAWGSGGQFFYVGWFNNSNTNDQVYLYNPKTGSSQRLAFNDASVEAADPAPIDNRYLIVSRAGNTDSQGGFDLSIADTQSNNVWPIPVNTNLDELGASYTPYQ